MRRYKVAHLREQGQDMIIVPLDPSFGRQTSQDQEQMIAELQMHARTTGLMGIVVPVWDGGGGRMDFKAPLQWHQYFKSINLPFIATNINTELYW
jgi:hypothetical protein